MEKMVYNAASSLIEEEDKLSFNIFIDIEIISLIYKSI